MIINNFSELATTDTRRDALEIINAGIEASLTKNAMKQITLEGNVLKIKDQEFDLAQFENIYVIGGGKAAADMAEEIEKILGDKITKGIITDVVSKELKRIEVVKGNHPTPSQTNVDACKRMVEIVKNASEKDLIINLISGGGSAILAYPRGTLEERIEMNHALLTKGTDIYQTNTVRKHISKIKGGQLSEISYPATLISLIFSDVLGNDLSVIASGCTVKDNSTLEDAKKIIEDFGLPKMEESTFKETPKDESVFSKTHNILLLDNSVAVEAMKNKAEELGYIREVLGLELSGEAKEIGKEMAEKIKPGVAMIAAGETTVTVTGHGKGGRNQELALGAIGNYRFPGCIISAGTDGIDNTEAAGAISDEKTKEETEKLGLNPEEFLQNNDAFNFFSKLNDLIMTGPTGTNVADIMLALGKK